MADTKSTIKLICLLFAAGALHAAAQNLVVQDIKTDPTNHKSIVTLRNDSGRTITGFTLSVSETYSGITTTHEVTEDYGPYAFEQGKAFNSGEEKQETVFSEQPGMKADKIKVKPIAVIYSDSSAEGKDDALGRIITVRKGMAASLEHSVKAMESALADANETHPALKAAKQLDADSRIKDAKGMDREYLRNSSERLKALSQDSGAAGSDERKMLADHVEKVKQEAGIYSSYANIRRPQ